VNSASISGAEQPMKLLEKHYPPPEYMLINKGAATPHPLFPNHQGSYVGCSNIYKYFKLENTFNEMNTYALFLSRTRTRVAWD
jgi:hypothetical protein